ncbi:hypothetical protein [Gymnodinialimonas sp.]
MVNETEHFNERLNRIQRGRRRNRGGMGFVVHPDGVVAPIGKPSSRLRFGFPLKGVLLGLMIAVAVKAYLMWFLGTDVYALEVQTLVTGAAFEQAAAMILMPDALSAWVVERYEDIYAFVQAGLAAGEPA